MKRITINKNDEPASVVEKIIDLPDAEVILVIPRFARFTESLGNFHLVKRSSALSFIDEAKRVRRTAFWSVSMVWSYVSRSTG